MVQPIVIVGMGACTPLGLDAASTAAAVRAGISVFSEHPYIMHSGGERVRLARAQWLDTELQGSKRLGSLMWPAIDEALEPMQRADAPPLRCAVALALPSPRPGIAPDLPATMNALIGDRYAKVFSAAALYPMGHAAGLLAIDAACRRLQAGGLDACMVAGVDSYVDPDALEWLEECDQLHSAGPDNNAWGFVPGEAAGALLLMSADTARDCGLDALGVILATGSAMEPKRIKTNTVCLGEGLTQAFRAVLTGLPEGSRISDIYCDLNGEPYRADEYGFSCLRARAAFVSPSDFIAPADCWGDVAAAGGPLHVMLSVVAGRKGYAQGPLALACASSEGGERAAVLVAIGTGA
jgi:3-oxoacyl-[acyl-carrier-protein] synthase I